MFSEIFNRLRNGLTVLGIAFVLAACGGGGGGGGGDIATTTSSSDVVSTTAVGTASIGWSAPANRADGQPLPLSEIKGYRIYYGTNSGVYTYQVDISDSATTSYTITDLPEGTYYLVLTTVDIYGAESGYSVEIVKTVDV